MSTIDELAATVRAGIGEKRLRANAAHERVAFEEAKAMHARVDRLLAEPHADTCSAVDPTSRTLGCTCDRDRRVAGYLALMVQAWQEGPE